MRSGEAVTVSYLEAEMLKSLPSFVKLRFQGAGLFGDEAMLQVDSGDSGV